MYKSNVESLSSTPEKMYASLDESTGTAKENLTPKVNHFIGSVALCANAQCFRSLYFRLYPFPHTLQTYFKNSVWTSTSCLFRWSFLANFLKQYPQTWPAGMVKYCKQEGRLEAGYTRYFKRSKSINVPSFTPN